MKLLLLGLLLINSAQADWKIADQSLELSACPDKKCYISSHCLIPKATCDAIQAHKNKRKGKIGAGGTNPGSEVCQQDFQGKVNLAMDSAGNTMALCQFKDGSFISLSGIWHF